MNAETLRTLSHCLMWASIALPILGGAAAVTRLYVESRLTTEEFSCTCPAIDSRSASRRLAAPAELVAALKPGGGAKVYFFIDGSEPESLELGWDLQACFRQAEWSVSSITRGGASNQIPRGILVYISQPDRWASPELARVESAIKNSGLPGVKFLSDVKQIPPALVLPSGFMVAIIVGRMSD